jgi:hypothetical protein
VNVHDRLLVPEPPLTLLGVKVHAVLLLAKLTVPVNPLSGLIVIVELPAVPAFTVTLVGVALIVKSATAILNVTVVL